MQLVSSQPGRARGRAGLVGRLQRDSGSKTAAVQQIGRASCMGRKEFCPRGTVAVTSTRTRAVPRRDSDVHPSSAEPGQGAPRRRG